uniref:enhancer of mRNA-decapping protein 3-like n=1 Tax=Ciona intestinalis TaxID=7719 RepID=UPI000180C4F1|nr:enhancer of mRNA-decapping protein 3-like [Ciona intestinalis]|eukprot:XP_002123787.1 enhancer of mRNA-decapping protein 3-like [Ciona intestinalis]
MTSQFVGRHVTVDLGPNRGFIQGRIKSVNATDQAITITNPHQSGIRCNFEEITLSAQEIVDLKLIDELMANGDTKKVVETKKNEKSSSVAPKTLVVSTHNKTTTPAFNTNPQTNSPPRPSHSFREQRHPYVKDGRPVLSGQPLRQKSGRNRNAPDCFNIDQSELDEDFDFEKNLALFDKQAVFDEVYSGSDGEVRTPLKNRRNKPEVKYRHDENVLGNGPVVYRQIVTQETSNHHIAEYYTDAGLVVPCVSSTTHKNICRVAEEMGISKTRQIETFGINTSQMAFSMLGGANRLHPRNAHQRPHVVVLTGPHQVGAQGIATARHLSNQNLHVDVFMADVVKMHDFLQDELKLLSLTTARLSTDIKDLPTTPVDLVIVAMDDEDTVFLRQQAWYKMATKWCSSNMAPILYLCPPNHQEVKPAIDIKWSLCSILPRSLPTSYGMIYLLDLSFPPKVFKKIGIKYQSPFCSKPFIALHRSH